MSDRFSYLKNCELFQRLDDDRLQRIESKCQVRQHNARSAVYLPSDQAEDVLLLDEGRVKVCNVTVQGKETILTLIEQGELFGQMAVFRSGHRDEYAEAMERSTVVYIPAGAVRELMNEHPDVSLGVAKLIAFRLAHIERRLANLMFLSNRERLVHLLLDMADRYGRPCDRGTALDIRISHHDLAKLIGCTRETVSITLGQLQNEGSVWRARQEIIVTDIERLAKNVQVPMLGDA